MNTYSEGLKYGDDLIHFIINDEKSEKYYFKYLFHISS